MRAAYYLPDGENAQEITAAGGLYSRGSGPSFSEIKGRAFLPALFREWEMVP